MNQKIGKIPFKGIGSSGLILRVLYRRTPPKKTSAIAARNRLLATHQNQLKTT